MKKTVLLLVLVHFCVATYAQTPADEIVARMNYVFEKVNRGKPIRRN